MWTTLKLALLAAGITVTAFANTSATACASALQPAIASGQTAAADQSECLSREQPAQR